MTTKERFLAKVEKHDDDCGCCNGCWHWKGAISAKGYGRFSYEGRNRLAYHVAYILFVGPIPDDDLQFDHVCRNRDCVNPAHIERVTPIENTRRGVNHNRAKTHCAKGHPFDAKNTRINPDGSRACRICTRVAVDAHMDRKRRAELSTR